VSDVPEILQNARDAHHRRDWPRAHELFAAARSEAPLLPEDLDALCTAAWWLGRVDDCLEAGDAAFRGYLDADRPRDAAMAALEMAISLFLRGDEAVGSGWIGRAHRLLEELPEGPEHGYARYLLEVEGGLEGDDLEAVASAARAVREIGRRHGDRNLVAAGVVGEGRALVKLGEVSRGMPLLDEAMVAVLHADLDLEWTGNIYCHLMAACHELADIRRASEWTEATAKWLSELPAAVLFAGICRVHRSQVLQVTGEWERAEREAACVLQDLADLHVASVAEAHYQVGEMRRLRGDLKSAEAAYARARTLGRDPQPGLALLCLAQGRTEAAAAGIRAALHAAGPDRLARAQMGTAHIEIALASGELDVAQRICAELEDAAASYRTSGLEAAALHWRGAVALAEGRPEEALPALRAACRRWHEVHAVYDAARACVLLGQAYGALGDQDAATSELETARRTFQRLGATIDARAVARLTGEPALPGGLTPREAEVLALVASGKTNQVVADKLVLSEKTIARHLSNIFAKLGVSSRTEAAAFAFQHGLAGSRRG
jgi:DNA-binding NarL/FixJ family response regulator